MTKTILRSLQRHFVLTVLLCAECGGELPGPRHPWHPAVPTVTAQSQLQVHCAEDGSIKMSTLQILAITVHPQVECVQPAHLAPGAGGGAGGGALPAWGGDQEDEE